MCLSMAQRGWASRRLNRQRRPQQFRVLLCPRLNFLLFCRPSQLNFQTRMWFTPLPQSVRASLSAREALSPKTRISARTWQIATCLANLTVLTRAHGPRSMTVFFKTCDLLKLRSQQSKRLSRSSMVKTPWRSSLWSIKYLPPTTPRQPRSSPSREVCPKAQMTCKIIRLITRSVWASMWKFREVQPHN